MDQNSSPQTQTAPEEISSRSVSYQEEKVKSGLADQCWLELVAYPPGSARSLWLNLPGEGWKRLDDPNDGVQDSVLGAFTPGSNQEVKVFYSGEKIVGLVVKSC